MPTLGLVLPWSYFRLGGRKQPRKKESTEFLPASRRDLTEVSP